MNNKNIIVKVRGIITRDNNLLVVKHKHSNFMSLPGGHLEYGENIINCLRRELVEEFGIEPEIGNLLYINQFIDSKKDEYIEFFFDVKNGGKYLNTSALKGTHSHELAKILWITSDTDIEILPKQFEKDFKNRKIFEGKIKFIDEL